MGNLIAVLSHCGRGDEMILGDQNHIFRYEQGGSSAVGGVHPRTLRNLPDGTLDVAEIEAAIRSDDQHNPISRLIALENTHSLCGGVPLALDYVAAVGAVAQRHGLALHVDGARIWNAAVALGVSPARALRDADSASVCLSKGLAAPVGSLVVGSAPFIKKARRMRKQVGGSMRQVGVLAAAGLIAITEMVERLADDHAHAAQLARGLARIDGILLDPATVKTNIIYFDIAPGAHLTGSALVGGLKRRGILASATGSHRLRFVTHYQICAGDVEAVLDGVAEIVRQGETAIGGGSGGYGG
jgi:threonine aldolase